MPEHMTRPRQGAISTDPSALIQIEGFRVKGIMEDGDATYLHVPMSSFLEGNTPDRDRHEAPRYGWKIHISAYPHNAQQIADAVIPVLHKMNVWHKYAKSLASLNKLVADPGQEGKFITIYTEDQDRSGGGPITTNIVARVEEALKGKGLIGPVVADERPLGTLGLIFMRWSDNYAANERDR